jgi:hypothetical protein
VGAARDEIAGTRQVSAYVQRRDYQWQHTNRTSLRLITDKEDLRNRVNELTKAKTAIFKNLVSTTKTILREAGWMDTNSMQAWAYGGFVYRIVRASLDSYVSLTLHLLAIANSDLPWAYTKMELDYHVEKLAAPRILYPSRTQALCAI